MNIGNILLYISLLSSCLAAVYMFTGRIKTSIQLLRTAAFSATFAVLFLAFAFIFLDFSLFYVWQHSSAELPVFYRLAAILVGQEGTYLIWAWLSLIVVLLYTELHGIHDRTAMITNVYALIVCAFLLVMTITMTPFRSIFAVGGASMPTLGNSISPELIDILMPLHIFTTFIAYAFTIIPAAMSLAYLTKRKNMPDSKNYLRIAWLFLSICIIAGGIWANRLLGWNGFWQWDPIQALSMCTWLLLTAALHAVVRLNVGEYKRLFPLLCIGTFLGSLYMTLLARSDVFGSIHSFPGTPTWWMIVIFIAIVIVFSLILALRRDKTEYTTSNWCSKLLGRHGLCLLFPWAFFFLSSRASTAIHSSSLTESGLCFSSLSNCTIISSSWAGDISLYRFFRYSILDVMDIPPYQADCTPNDTALELNMDCNQI